MPRREPRDDRRRPGLAGRHGRLAAAPSTRTCGSSRLGENVGFGAGQQPRRRARERPLAAAAEQRRLRATRAAIDELVRFVEAHPTAGAVGPRLLLGPTGGCSARAGAFRRSSASPPSTSTCASSRRARALLNGFYCGDFDHDRARPRRLADGRLPARAPRACSSSSAASTRRSSSTPRRSTCSTARRTRAARPGSTPPPRSCTCGAARPAAPRRRRSRSRRAATCATCAKHASRPAAARAAALILLAGLRLRAPRARRLPRGCRAGSQRAPSSSCSPSRRPSRRARRSAS